MSRSTSNIADTDIEYYIDATKHHNIKRRINGIYTNKNCSKHCNIRVNYIVNALYKLKEDRNSIYGYRRFI